MVVWLNPFDFRMQSKRKLSDGDCDIDAEKSHKHSWYETVWFVDVTTIYVYAIFGYFTLQGQQCRPDT